MDQQILKSTDAFRKNNRVSLQPWLLQLAHANLNYGAEALKQWSTLISITTRYFFLVQHWVNYLDIKIAGDRFVFLPGHKTLTVQVE